jgi:hypothetical protein
MKYLVFHMGLLMCLFLSSCASRNASAQDSKPEFRVTVKNQDDKITILDENSRTVIEIHSDFGIGSASLTLVSGTMPDTLLLRLHTQGLEEFQLISAQVTLDASVPSGEAGQPVGERIVSSALEYPILPGHPLWMRVEVVAENKNIPLDEGYFEITIPREFLRNAGASFEVRWIDFYR